MRKLMALMVSMCGGAASAYAAEPKKWCSDGFDKPAELVLTSDGPILTIGGKPVEIGDDGHEPAITTARISLTEDSQPSTLVWIYQDRIFRPCE